MMRNLMMRNLLAAGLLVASILLSNPVQAQTLHALLVGDTIDLVSNPGKGIGVSVQSDLDRFHREIERLATAAGLKFNGIVVKDLNFNGKQLVGALATMKRQVKRDDVVVFLYSGHGIGDATKDTKWPFMVFPDGDLDSANIVDAIADMHPRLMLSLIDACNSQGEPVNRPPGQADGGVLPLQMTASERVAIRSLLTEYQGTVVAASARPGEVSAAPASGGILAGGFLRALATEVRSTKPSLENVMRNATASQSETSASGRVKRQTPVLEQRLTRTRSVKLGGTDADTGGNQPQPELRPSSSGFQTFD
ncbi:MAG: caspase family protein [Alphaproteobacteria bacterium]